MKRKRFTEEQIIGVLKENEAGAKVDDFATALQDSLCEPCYRSILVRSLDESAQFSAAFVLLYRKRQKKTKRGKSEYERKGLGIGKRKEIAG